MARNRWVRGYRLGFGVLELGTLIFLTIDSSAKIDFISFFTVQSNFIASMVLLTGALLVPRPTLSWDLVRGAAAMYMILTGVILGVLFRSAAGLVARLLDPNSFAVVQSATVASFSRIDAGLLPFGVGATVLAIAAALWLAPRLDVMALGRDVAVSLGLHYDRLVLATLALIAVLVAVSTAMVGPVTFFGLVVAGLAHGLARSARHAQLLPVAALIAAVILVGGQTLFERALGQTATLSVVVDFLGGLFFLSLLLKGQIR